MDFDPLWTELRDRCASLGSDEVLVTPASDAAFRVVATREDRIAVEFVDDGTLRRAAEGEGADGSESPAARRGQPVPGRNASATTPCCWRRPSTAVLAAANRYCRTQVMSCSGDYFGVFEMHVPECRRACSRTCV